jgi:aryl-alcohol dehydrogenase-like predicted oxidoreductase
LAELNAGRSGTFRIGGDSAVNRLGFGAMRITGQGIWGEPADRAGCIATLRRLPEIGVNFIDTADSYGPDVSEHLIRAALHPYDGILIATKGGLTRTGPNLWHPVGRPEYLRQQAMMSRRFLGVEQIGLWQLHRIDPKVPVEESLGAVARLQRQGKIRHIGLSEVKVPEIEQARKVCKIVSVQNQYNMTDRKHEDVLDYCTKEGIAFIPWAPVAAGKMAQPGGKLDEAAKKHNVTVGQLSLAWLLHRSPVIVPIPGTSSVEHLEENVKAQDVTLTDAEWAEIETVAG